MIPREDITDVLQSEARDLKSQESHGTIQMSSESSRSLWIGRSHRRLVCPSDQQWSSRLRAAWPMPAAKSFPPGILRLQKLQ